MGSIFTNKRARKMEKKALIRIGILLAGAFATFTPGDRGVAVRGKYVC
jgi:hypothetical protein